MIGDCGSMSFVMKWPMIERWPVLGGFVTADGMVGLVVGKVVLVDEVGGWWGA